MQLQEHDSAATLPPDCRRISQDQKVGDGFHCYRLRDLYADPQGNRHSVNKTPWMLCEKPRRTN